MNSRKLTTGLVILLVIGPYAGSSTDLGRLLSIRRHLVPEMVAMSLRCNFLPRIELT
jgi:hypothetical protein